MSEFLYSNYVMRVLVTNASFQLQIPAFVLETNFWRVRKLVFLVKNYTKSYFMY